MNQSADLQRHFEANPKAADAVLAEAAKNGTGKANGRGGTDPSPVFSLLSACGFNELEGDSSAEQLEKALRALSERTKEADPLRRELIRQAAIKKLKEIEIPSPTRILSAALGMNAPEENSDERQGKSVILQDPEPWPEPVEGSNLLDALAATFRRFLILPDFSEIISALFVLHTYAISVAQVSPFFVATSPEPRCGKSLLLEILLYLVFRPLTSSNITPSALFRAIEKYTPSLIIDEADTFLRDSEEFRGILNGGHRQSTAVVIRTVGDDHEPRTFSTFGPKVIALIGKLPQTLADRSIIIHLRRKKKEESVEEFSADNLIPELEPLRRKAARWVKDHLSELKSAKPEIPGELHDRAKDNWKPLLAIADAAGGDWPDRAREAAKSLSGAEDEGEASVRALLLGDLRDLFAARGVDELPSSAITDALAKMEEKPWPEWKSGKPMTPRQLARLLGPFGIQPKQLRVEGEKVRGYELAALEETFARYLGSDPVQAVHPYGCNNLQENLSGTKGVPVPDPNPAKPLKTGPVPDVPDEIPLTEEEDFSLFSEETL